MIPDYLCNAVYFSEWLKMDYMPLQLDKERYLCYEYKPDYLMKSVSNRKYITDSLDICRDMQLKIKETPLIIDGGNVVKVGNKAIMTEKVFVENTTVNENILKRMLEEQMECEIIFIPQDRAEKYGHSDGIIKPISDNSILMTNYHDFDKEYSNEVINRLSNKFDIKILSYNVKKTSPESWAYINFLTVGNLIVLPVLGKEEEEEQALEQVNAYYPNYTIEQLNISDLVKDGGGLNCVSWCRFINEEERKYLLLYNSLKSEKEMTDDNMFSKDEIIFMCKKNLRKFADKFPGIAEYYIKCLDD